MRALDDMGEDSGNGEDVETVSSVLNTIVDETAAHHEDDDDDENNDDDVGLASRISKRSTNTENDAHQMKRLRSSPVVTINSV
jgi:hypothetical protein